MITVRKTLLCILIGCFMFTYNPKAQIPADLVPISQATHTAQASGDWSDADTWGGTLPNDGAHVVIPNNITVTVDSEINDRIKTIRLDGKLRFDNNTNTLLNVGTIIGLMSGELEIGTSTNPIQQGVTAKITFIDEGPLDLDWDFQQFSKGMVMMGQTTIYGFQKTPWVALSSSPSSGQITLSLDSTTTGWEVGDQLVITGTDPNDPESDEIATIAAVSGTTVTLTQPLTKDHLSPQPDLEVHVANLNRNVVFSSENPTIGRRGHIMFMHNLDVDVNYARFYQLGRTNKLVPVDDWEFPDLGGLPPVQGARTNIRGRYSVHFHRGGVDITSTPATVKGCVVEDDPGWAYVNHTANVDFIENVSYNVVGGAFQTEAGDEIGSFKNNIAIRTVNPDFPLLNPDFEDPDAREIVQDFAFQGDGFWVHGGGVELEGNIVSGCSGHGFIYWPEGLVEAINGQAIINQFLVSNVPNGNLLPDLTHLNTWWVPVAKFKNNTAYSATKGFSSFYLHTTLFADIDELTPAYLNTVHSTLEGFTAWNVLKTGLELNFTERFTVIDAKLINSGDVNSIGIDGNHSRNFEQQTFENCTIEGFGIGFDVPTQGQVSVICGNYSNLTDFRIMNPQSDGRDLRIDGITLVNATLFNPPDIVNFQMNPNFKLLPETQGQADPDDGAYKYLLYFLLPDKIILNFDSFFEQRLYFNDQVSSFTPITDANNTHVFEPEYAVPNEFVDKTNQQLWDQYDLTFGGGIMPDDAVTNSQIVGGKISSTQPSSMDLPICRHLPVDDLLECLDGATAFVEGPFTDFNHDTCLTTPLPVELFNFRAGKTNTTDVLLDWTTLSESNTNYFEIERGVDGQDWDLIDVVPAAQQSSSVLRYQYLDEKIGLTSGTYYYRLRIVDLDGSYQYSNIVQIKFVSEEIPKMFPNPTSGHFTIQGVFNNGNVQIFSSTGRLLLLQDLANQRFPIDINISSLPAGLYFVKVSDSVNSYMFIQQIVKK